MALSLKRTLALVLMALALAAGLLGLNFRMAAASAIQHPTGIRSGHTLADDNWYCPAPPRNC